MELRRAAAADAPDIAAVLAQAFLEYRELYTPEGYSATTPDEVRVRQRMTEGPVWIALEGGYVHGTVAAYLKESRCYIRGMAILPASRGLGIGGLLLQAVEEFAASSGAHSLTLSTTPFLDRAIRLYQRHGFERSEDGPHDLGGTPLFTMTKQLAP